MSFKTDERQRQASLKERLFSPAASLPGKYADGLPREFCLHENHATENLHPVFRAEALGYFRDRRIRWHDSKNGAPSNHLCCSQSSCVNFWFPFAHAPEELARVLRELGYDVCEMLTFDADTLPLDRRRRFTAFEWIGLRNYLGELRGSRVADDEGRSRGSRFTSLDFAFRFRRSDGRIQILAGEWKYTERYAVGRSLRYSKSGTDRLERIYGPHLARSDSQILKVPASESLFYDPFDQLMRQQLLCSAMEREHEMGAEVVSLMHVAPAANRELLNSVTSPDLGAFGSHVHEIWSALTKPERFKGVHMEDLLALVCSHAPDAGTADYLQLRYGGMAPTRPWRRRAP